MTWRSDQGRWEGSPPRCELKATTPAGIAGIAASVTVALSLLVGSPASIVVRVSVAVTVPSPRRTHDTRVSTLQDAMQACQVIAILGMVNLPNMPRYFREFVAGYDRGMGAGASQTR